ncbi:DUF2691 family protein [Cohnella sp. AR92]|uniref:DUF2691 family protein n=1 Tax=Cohnella sp. AR92 TaxID=648716 RepID=UPI000F8C9A17|nr:DUF2691 family protein [Cohnella sp. AR92]RUS45366.1 DUF2691 family protein [Cohnella sp. AR92]
MRRGIQLEIPNEWGNHLGEVLEPFDISRFDWYIGGEEAYQDVEGGEMEPLFQGETYGMKGRDLDEILNSKRYYIIFGNFKAYPQDASIEDVLTYEEFLNSRCQLIVLVVDCSYVAIYCKDTVMLTHLYRNALEKGFENVVYITDENDARTRLSVW